MLLKTTGQNLQQKSLEVPENLSKLRRLETRSCKILRKNWHNGRRYKEKEEKKKRVRINNKNWARKTLTTKNLIRFWMHKGNKVEVGRHRSLLVTYIYPKRGGLLYTTVLNFMLLSEAATTARSCSKPLSSSQYISPKNKRNFSILARAMHTTPKSFSQSRRPFLSPPRTNASAKLSIQQI